ncbi:BMP family ABC transporter substrate-binding protein [Staphylothermus hellenicus]|uniref:Basic membrane lipoprotein n=1 Tax=Staphylothermus hellenicus (strain DSM 12710 / JCM 10830 / BK20S6-10-b1 / P8) TaxID=591019 RepID=D7DCB1_STAHD|nr:BMP family ABC transporter substrate-binding protein [Staphylothermus hellenicus]ADI31808.1 basic membrane lipoprotein [Staphylothermus hellenicus DSM 12710]
MDVKTLTGIFVVLLIVVGALAYYAGTLYGGGQTYGAGGTVTTTVTKTETKTVGGGGAWTPPSTIKAAFIYVGPIGDFGWSYMHDVGRRVVATVYKDWLQTTYVESVSEDKVGETIDNLVSQGYNVIFTTSFEFMDKTIEKGEQYPNILFFHCSGYKRRANVGTYFADLYQVYYLNGLIAGALTKTGHIGYVAAFTTPEVVRHINAFAIGAKEVGEQLGKDIKVHVIEIGAWFAPDKARSAAETLWRDYNVDVLAYTEDSTAILELAQEKTTGYEQGTYDHPLYVFSHYSPGYKYGPDAVVSGQIVRWEVIYMDILAKIKAGIYTPYNLGNVDYWYLLNSGAVEFGCEVYENGSVMHINPKFVDTLKSIQVTDKVTGKKMSVYDLVMERYKMFKSAPLLTPLQLTALTHIYENITKIRIPAVNPQQPDPYSQKDIYIGTVFDPFTGPLSGYAKDNPSQKVNIPAGQRLGHDDLWSMDWFVDWVIYHGGLS